MNEQIDAILFVLRQQAPSPEDVDAVNQMSRDLRVLWRTDDKEILRALVGSLYDGLAWGNWPWTKFAHEVHGKEVKKPKRS